MDDYDGVSTLGFPSHPAPPGFIQTVRPGDIPEPAGPSSLFDSSPTFPEWYPPAPPDNAQDVLRLFLSLSPIDRVLQELRWSACLPLLRWCPTILMGTQDCCQRFSVLHLSVLHNVPSSCWMYLTTVLSTVQPGSLRPALRDLFRVGGPVLVGNSTIERSRFRIWMCLSQYYIPV